MAVDRFRFEALTLASAFSDRTHYHVQLIFGKLITSNAVLRFHGLRSNKWAIAIQANGCSNFEELRETLYRSLVPHGEEVFITEIVGDRFYIAGDIKKLLQKLEDGDYRHPFFQTNKPEEIREVIDLPSARVKANFISLGKIIGGNDPVRTLINISWVSSKCFQKEIFK